MINFVLLGFVVILQSNSYSIFKCVKLKQIKNDSIFFSDMSALRKTDSGGISTRIHHQCSATVFKMWAPIPRSLFVAWRP